MRCLICAGETTLFCDEKLGLESYRCHHCACIFKTPQSYQDIETQKKRYDLHDNDAQSAGYRAYFGRFLDFVLPNTGRPESALDFGCGRSTLLATLLADRGIRCDVYDPIYYPDTAYLHREYPLIVSTEVFEHLHDPAAVFERLVACMKKDGYLAIQTQFVPESIQEYLHWYYRQDPTHIVFFALRSFEILSERFGCRVLGDNGKNMLVIQKK